MGGDWYTPIIVYGIHLKYFDVVNNSVKLADKEYPINDYLCESDLSYWYDHLQYLNVLLTSKYQLNCTIIEYVTEAYSRWDGVDIEEDSYNFVIGWKVPSDSINPIKMLEWAKTLPLDELQKATEVLDFDKTNIQSNYYLGIEL